jgi:hypothetical protein
MNNQLHFQFARRFAWLLVSLSGGVFLTLTLLLVLPSLVSSAYARPLSQLSNGSGWRQANPSGFGSIANGDVHTLEAYNGQLYAGATNYDQGATIWRTANGITWTLSTSPGFSNTYTNTNPVVYDLVEFNSQLYAGTGNWADDGVGGQIWRSTNGTDWTPIESGGFGDTNNAAVTTFGILSSTIYAATGGNANGLQIWRSNTGNVGSWTRVITDGNGDANNQWVTGFSVFNGYLYAAIETTITSSVQIWRTNDGTSWTQANTSGFGDANNYQTGGMAVFSGYLYVGTRNAVTGAQMWRSSNGTTWNQVVGNGFGDINNLKIESLMVFDGALYAVTDNEVTGLEVWRSQDGTSWSQDAPDGFGGNNCCTLWSNATAIFNNSLVIGTSNYVTGGQVWQRVRQVYLPLIMR